MHKHIGCIYYLATCVAVSWARARIRTTIKCLVVLICGQTDAACKLQLYCAVYHGTGMCPLAHPDVHCLRVNVGLGRRFRHVICGVSHCSSNCGGVFQCTCGLER